MQECAGGVEFILPNHQVSPTALCAKYRIKSEPSFQFYEHLSRELGYVLMTFMNNWNPVQIIIHQSFNNTYRQLPFVAVTVISYPLNICRQVSFLLKAFIRNHIYNLDSRVLLCCNNKVRQSNAQSFSCIRLKLRHFLYSRPLYMDDKARSKISRQRLLLHLDCKKRISIFTSLNM